MPNTSERILDELLLKQYSRRQGPEPTPAPVDNQAEKIRRQQANYATQERRRYRRDVGLAQDATRAASATFVRPAPPPVRAIGTNAGRAPRAESFSDNRPQPPQIFPSSGTPPDVLRASINDAWNTSPFFRRAIQNIPMNYYYGEQQIPGNPTAGGDYTPPVSGLVPEVGRKMFDLNPVVNVTGTGPWAQYVARHEYGHAADQMKTGDVFRRSNPQFVADVIDLASRDESVRNAYNAWLQHPSPTDSELVAFIMAGTNPEWLPPGFMSRWFAPFGETIGQGYAGDRRYENWTLPDSGDSGWRRRLD